MHSEFSGHRRLGLGSDVKFTTNASGVLSICFQWQNLKEIVG